MEPESVVWSTFPELDAIDDEELAAGVVRAWARAITETGVDDLDAIPWYPPVQHQLALPDERLVPHVRDVTQMAIGMAETLVDHRGSAVDVDLDLVVAGALLHDVSKLYEFDGTVETEVGDLLGHPYFGVHVVADAGLPVELAHVVLSHTSRTTVEPAFLEAEIVRRADEAAASAIRASAVEDLRDA